MNSLKGKVALVTGASRGIGRAIALCLATAGANICINHVHPQFSSLANQVKKEIEKFGRRVIIIRADISKEEEVKRLVNEVIKEFGKIDILVNNAGIFPLSPGKLTHQISLREWNKILKVNLTGVFLCSKYCLDHMIPKNIKGRIINVSSVAALTGGSFMSGAYTVSKSGVIGLTYCLARQYGKFGIITNAVVPGLTRTDVLKIIPEQHIKDHISETPLGRIMEPSEIAEAVVFLLTHPVINGQILVVDGGRVHP